MSQSIKVQIFDRHTDTAPADSDAMIRFRRIMKFLQFPVKSGQAFRNRQPSNDI